MDTFEEDLSPIDWDESDMQVLAELRFYARMPDEFGTFELVTPALLFFSSSMLLAADFLFVNRQATTKQSGD